MLSFILITLRPPTTIAVHLTSVRASAVPERAPRRWRAKPFPVPLASSSSPTSQGTYTIII